MRRLPEAVRNCLRSRRSAGSFFGSVGTRAFEGATPAGWVRACSLKLREDGGRALAAAAALPESPLVAR